MLFVCPLHEQQCTTLPGSGKFKSANFSHEKQTSSDVFYEWIELTLTYSLITINSYENSIHVHSKMVNRP